MEKIKKIIEKNIKIIFLIFLIFYLILIFLNKDIYFELIEKTAPFREMYFPDIFSFAVFYIFPIVIALLLARFVSKKSLFYVSLIFIMPNIVLVFNSMNYFQSITQYYYIIFFLLVFSFFWICKDYNGKVYKTKNTEINEKINNKILYLFFGLGLLLLLFLNLIPIINSKYIVGADVHYHIALTKKINLLSWSQHPIFYEERNFIPALVHCVIKILHNILNISIENIWRFYSPVLSVLFLLLCFLFVKSLKDEFTAVISILFILPWGQILFNDPAPRLFGWVVNMISLFLFSLYIKNNEKKFLFFSLIISFLTVLIHFFHFVEIFIIYIFYFIITKSQVLNKIKNKSNIYIRHQIIYENSIFYILYIFLILSFLLIYIHNLKKEIIYNEMPLSVFYPWGIISFLIVVFFLPGFLNSLKKITKQNILIYSIVLLSINLFFYLVHLWNFHARYFVETAFLGMAILAAEFIKDTLKNLSENKRKLLISILFGFLIMSIYPRIQWMYNYSININKAISSYKPILDMINSNIGNNKVIMAPPDDFINRYIPTYTNCFIFGAKGSISKEQQWSVLATGCLTLRDITLKRKNICDERYQLSKDFFYAPNDEKILILKNKYKIDYILLFDNSVIYKYIKDNLKYKKVFSYNKFYVYKILFDKN